jgi:hypothetical protein
VRRVSRDFWRTNGASEEVYEIQTPKISLVVFFNLRHKSNNVSILVDKSGNDSPNP